VREVYSDPIVGIRDRTLEFEEALTELLGVLAGGALHD
jgi:hypothetical protein